MKRLLKIIGLLSLVIFSFFYTEKTISVVMNMDSLMDNIKKASETIKIDPINARIEGDTIIPGLSGKKVDEKKSYSNMKRLGSYNETLLIYKETKPEISISNNYDKYIIKGNPNKKMASFIFKVNDGNNIDNIIKILDENNIKGNFFVDGLWLEANNGKIIDLIKEGHNIGNMSYNLDYTNSSFIWMNTIINKIAGQKDKYCYSEEENKDTIDNCSLQKNYTIRPNIIIKTNPLLELKQNLISGSIISFNINDNLIKELPLIIDYINSKGYQITPLYQHIKE